MLLSLKKTSHRAGGRERVKILRKPQPLCRPYGVAGFSVWNSYGLLCTYTAAARSRQNTLSCGGVVMAKRIQTEKGASPYSVLPCVLLLLAAGLVVKIGVAAQLMHHVH
jgi:hypothetical protein